jgi:hypothetical protein
MKEQSFCFSLPLVKLVNPLTGGKFPTTRELGVEPPVALHQLVTNIRHTPRGEGGIYPPSPPPG